MGIKKAHRFRMSIIRRSSAVFILMFLAGTKKSISFQSAKQNLFYLDELIRFVDYNILTCYSGISIFLLHLIRQIEHYLLLLYG